MSSSPKRSVNAELHIGAEEGNTQRIGKDWGGPQDLRSYPPLPATEEEDYADDLLDR